MEFIPYSQHFIDDDDINAVVETLKKGYLTTGPKVAEFEAAICEETGARYAVAVANGTAALHIAAIAMGIGPGDEVILPPKTFAASANCILYCGATPVFADIDMDTMLLDIEDVKRKITKNTKAVLPVHYGGECCNLEEYKTLCEERRLVMLQDAAHSLGSKINNNKLGQYPGMQIWSFHPAKTVTTAEGGAVTTNDEAFYKKLLRLRTHGITRDVSQWVNQDAGGGWYYEQLDLGYNYRIPDVLCALGISQLKKLPQFAKRRAEIVARYNKAFEGMPFLIQKTPEWSQPVRHLYTIRLHDIRKREDIFDALREKNIGVNVHYIPVYWLPYYRKLGYMRGICPNAERSYLGMVTIPLYPAMTDEQVDYVIDCVRECNSLL